MYRSIYDLKDFYNNSSGDLVRRVVQNHLGSWWDNVKDLRVVGIGYAQPYLGMFLDKAERVISISPAGQGTYHWPDPKKNLAALAEESELPIETNSVDRVLLIHSLEHAELLRSNLQEIWRILKSNGRLIVVAPNRRGLWSRAEWSPFGQGTPYSRDQLRFFLRDNLFVYERSACTLYTPPIRWNIVRNASDTMEKYLPWLFPGMGGLHVVEASKQIYSGLPQVAENRVIVRGRHGLLPSPVPDMRTNNSKIS
ncbi:MAG TPA: methyltransferase domain-containing protein [Alphaproteobacteria bacterium]|mgnify:CR=1 FL=1|jgi:SAM-dependent methyltransferase|nr:methyltransferase domain-containing protein [Alphaproteobacteria bacterium]HRK98494.1 methyltransferase domain-containing protein [Alphaproteobacteria bacterium]